MQISKITKCSLVNIPHHKQQSNCIPRQQQQKKQSCVKLIEYQKVYLLQYGHFMNVKKIYLLHIYKLIGSAVHKTVHKCSVRDTNMFAVFGFSCTRFAVSAPLY
jgi:hypothetical protein